jgi:hypothetical protein
VSLTDNGASEPSADSDSGASGVRTAGACGQLCRHLFSPSRRELAYPYPYLIFYAATKDEIVITGCATAPGVPQPCQSDSSKPVKARAFRIDKKVPCIKSKNVRLKTPAEESSSRLLRQLAPKAQPPRKRSGQGTARG